MKKLLMLSSMLGLIGVSSNSSADTVLGVYAGAQGWNMGVEGGFSRDENLAQFGFEDETNSSFYLALEHLIPVIPNIKVIQTEYSTEGGTSLTSTFTFGDEVYSANTLLETDIDLSTTDYILYYEILDNDIASIDIGINAKQVDGEFVVVDSETQRSAIEDFDGFVPMAYGRLAFGVPGTGLGVYAEGSFLSIDDSSISDYQVALTYSFVESLAIDLTLQAGYRSTALDIEDIDGIFADLEFDGAFAGIEVHF
ncbi:TIGR04219 family outer membrane beta-barrel protein [Agaribacter flavus]|uniref:TIGR04219 family outer membrane beta-barrel protein n=1 Tax=Agaribacter flavus TaxID=1902781 RepID=A0ABV7FMB0_9ALTE